MQVIHADVIRKIYKPKAAWSHKGDFGKVLVIGGSQRYTGSPAFCALAAMRAGADLATVVAPKRAADIVASFSPDIITVPMEGDTLSVRHVKAIIKECKSADAVVIGNGAGTEKNTLSAIAAIIKKVSKPMVIDADGIHAIDRIKLNKNIIITPHAAEFYALTGNRVKNDVSDRVEKTKAAAEKFGCIILLKGHADVISDGKTALVNETGNAYMTKGGTGDTLAGICGAMLARGIGTINAACGAAFLNGTAGDMAEKLGEGMLASDVLGCIPAAIRKYAC